MTVATEEVKERFFSKTTQKNDCIIWTASKSNDGYGHFWIDKKCYQAHRVAWLLEYNSWPTNTLDHTCSNRDCVNVGHLKDIPHSSNCSLGRTSYATTCKHGHDLTNPDNIEIRSDGGERCKLCRKSYSRQQTLRRQAARKGYSSK